MLAYNVHSCQIITNHSAEEVGKAKTHWGKKNTQDNNSRPNETSGEAGIKTNKKRFLWFFV